MTLQQICENASRIGREIDLTGCDYGPHKRSNTHLGVLSYYYVLAGFARSLDCARILEIGTSYGGSMMAMSRGCDSARPGLQLVTVDKVDIAGPGIKALAQVKRVVGDSLAPKTLQEVKRHLTPKIDLLYIDSKHSYDHTIANIATYGGEFLPRFLILDDIHLNPEMERLWSEIAAKYGQYAFDASELSGRPSGFGVLDYAGANLK